MSFLPSNHFLAGIGLILSVYAVYVEYKVEHLSPDEEFTALCDIQALNASCSAVFAMPVGKMLSYFGLVPEGSMLDVPNAALGILFYSWRLLLGNNTFKPNGFKYGVEDLTHLITVGAMASSVFLAYQLTFVIVELCVLCWTTHVINSILTYRMIQSTRSKSSSSKVKGM